MRASNRFLLLLIASGLRAHADDDHLKPFVMDHRAAGVSAADVSFLLDAPAGKHGFTVVRNGHLEFASGGRARFWGVHFTDWSRGSIEIPTKEDSPLWAATLARFGVNMVRLHFLDLAAPRGIIDTGKGDSRSFDPTQLDRLDFEIAEFKRRGIYVDLNLNVGRSYLAGDGVQDFDRIRWGKGLTLFDPRLIELQKEYARKLLTHRNPYTGLEYRNDPAIAIVEILNENGLYLGFRAPTPYYDDELTTLYNRWLEENRSGAERKRLRDIAAVAENAPIPRLKGSEAASVPDERYRTEMAFYMNVENRFYQHMSRFLKQELGVQCPITGTADHSHSSSPYPMLTALSKLDIVDGHVYWQHPGSPPPVNTAMVDDPLHSTIVQLSRTAVAGKPYTVSEVNHPFPNDYAAEGIPALAAYGSLQDWDAILLYTFEPKRDTAWQPVIGDPFDISHDPVRMTEMALGALMFLRGDVHPAKATITRGYTEEQVLASRKLPSSEAPYFTPGFSLALPLEHAVRIGTLQAAKPSQYPAEAASREIRSDTGELLWTAGNTRNGLITIDTPRTQGFVGFLHSNRNRSRNLSVDVDNEFAAVVLSSLENKPLSDCSRVLLITGSRVANTGMKWNEPHTRLANQGESPTLIEPVTGTVMLNHLNKARGVQLQALDGHGRPAGAPVIGEKTAEGWSLRIGGTVTPWYLIEVQR